MSSQVTPCPQNITPHHICSDLPYSPLSPSKPSSWSLPLVAVFPFLYRAIHSCPPFESAVYPSAQQIPRFFWEPTMFKKGVVNLYKSWIWLSVACWALNASPRQVEGNPKGLSSQLREDLETAFLLGPPFHLSFPSLSVSSLVKEGGWSYLSLFTIWLNSAHFTINPRWPSQLSSPQYPFLPLNPVATICLDFVVTKLAMLSILSP